MLMSVPTMASATIHKFWSPLWEKAVEETSLEDMMTIAALNMARGFVLNSEVHNTLKAFMEKVDHAEVKAKKLSQDLHMMGLVNTRLGSENKSLQLKVEAMISAKVVLKIKLDVAAEDMRHVEIRVLEAQGLRRTTEEARNRLSKGRLQSRRPSSRLINTLTP
ncbi:hypothetical protein Adt_18867 [Abeliophyllum distichum]|uniref:Uncharacterized protein n=1 Tax=Abeliophyllum distichum TaxID=126358 RepID=A0ABD1TKK6_9LAMI